MTLSATATQGFEYMRDIQPGEVIWQPADPGDSVTRGDLMVQTAGEGLLDIAADSEVPVARAMMTMTMAASSTAFPYPRDFDAGNPNNTLLPVQVLAPAGTPIYLATFAGHHDDTVAAYTASTPSMTLTTSTGANDDINGGIVYVYSGTGAGQVNVVADYVHATKVATLHRAFETALDTTSKVIILEGEGSASDGIGFLGRMDIQDQNNLHTADGADDGDWIVYLDWSEAAEHLKNLRVPVIRATALL